jgi:hypothetical protein
MAVLTSVGCAKKAPEIPPEASLRKPTEVQAEPAATPDAAVQAEVAPAAPDAAVQAEVAPEEPGAATAQCKRILEKSWQAIQPAFTKLKVEVTDDLRERFLTSSYETERFNEACPNTPKVYRDCIEANDNPLHFIANCQERMAEPRPDVLPIPIPALESPLFASAELSAEAGTQLLARIVGTWELTDGGGTETWVIAADGKVEVTRVRDGKQQERRSMDSFKISFAKSGEVVADYGANVQTLTFLLAEDGKTLYMSGNTQLGVYPFRDGKTFVVRDQFARILVNDGACEVVSAFGSVVPATCGFSDRDGARFFDISYQVPGAFRFGTTEPELTQTSFPVVGSNLVAPNLLKWGAYTRK